MKDAGEGEHSDSDGGEGAPSAGLQADRALGDAALSRWDLVCTSAGAIADAILGGSCARASAFGSRIRGYGNTELILKSLIRDLSRFAVKAEGWPADYAHYGPPGRDAASVNSDLLTRPRTYRAWARNDGDRWRLNAPAGLQRSQHRAICTRRDSEKPTHSSNVAQSCQHWRRWQGGSGACTTPSPASVYI